MNIDDYNWDELYKKCDDYMKSIRVNEYNIAKNIKCLYLSNAIVEVSFPKRNDIAAIIMLENNKACIKRKGYVKDGRLFCVYGIRVGFLN